MQENIYGGDLTGGWGGGCHIPPEFHRQGLGGLGGKMENRQVFDPPTLDIRVCEKSGQKMRGKNWQT